MSDQKRPPGVVNTCPQCGQPVPEGTAVCPNCGAAQPQKDREDRSGSAPPPGVPGQQQTEPPTPSKPEGFNNVSFWPRVLASLIDGLVVLVMQLPVFAALAFAGVIGVSLADLEALQSPEGQRILNLMTIPMSIIQVAYYTIMNGTWGATLGKMAMGMKIVREDGNPIGYGVALGRIVVKLILAQCTCSLMYLSVAVNSEHRGWHDQIVGTRVIDRKSVV